MVTQRTHLARQLRTEPTNAERKLWQTLRGNQLGVKFRRQFPLGPYILAFVSLDARLAIEVDGGQHNESEADVQRDRFVESQGFTVLRFWNNDLLQNIDGVAATIARLIPPKFRGDGLTPP